MSDTERAAALAEPDDDLLVAELESEDCDTAPVEEAELIDGAPAPEDGPGAELLPEGDGESEAPSEDPTGVTPSGAAEAVVQAAREGTSGEEPPFDRFEYLEPFVEPIAAALELTDVEDDDDLIMRFAGEPVSVSAWARSVALGVLGATEARETSAYRIVESLALEAKIKEDLARITLFQQALDPTADLEEEQPAEVESGEGSVDADDEESLPPPKKPKPKPPAHLRAELVHDAALGRALMAELQRVIDAAVVNGNMELAKSLTSFKPALNHAVNDVRELLEPEDLDEAHSESDKLIRIPSDAELPEIRRRRRRRRKMEFTEDELAGTTIKEGRVKPDRAPRRVRVMATALVTLILVWAALMVPRWFEERQRIFTIDDFGNLPGVQRVVARPPSLFVTLDNTTWQGLKERERRDLVDEIAFGLSRAGYTGARFATGDGRTVAQWLKSRGVEIKAPPKVETKSNP